MALATQLLHMGGGCNTQASHSQGEDTLPTFAVGREEAALRLGTLQVMVRPSDVGGEHLKGWPGAPRSLGPAAGLRGLGVPIWGLGAPIWGMPPGMPVGPRVWRATATRGAGAPVRA